MHLLLVLSFDWDEHEEEGLKLEVPIFDVFDV